MSDKWIAVKDTPPLDVDDVESDLTNRPERVIIRVLKTQ